MRAIFVTTDSVDCFNHVRAWNSCFPKSTHHTFNLNHIRNDHLILEAAKGHDVIFYIGAVKGNAVPRYKTFQKLREIAPVINICSDAADKPWEIMLGHYKRRESFDLQVSIDGAKDSPVDLATLTPVDSNPFKETNKDIRCGFSGTVGGYDRRSQVVMALNWLGGLTLRERCKSYEDHVNFMARCRMMLNTSWTGTGHAHHIKGRVIEAGWAGCALLEHADSPISEWFPEDCYFRWGNPKEAAEIIKNSTDEEIAKKASRLSEEIRNRFTAKQIYGEILNFVDITH